ncbi:uncharacterized protein LOC131927998 [Physella acuta]|uniref:uncharacterized protein LOC131927998 n=1 Tax=Physella acuta TaxID=109671 RepID=UPI0027DB7421|nr:uncharacterized protein LOC131927998 [Physella acuta]
MHYTEDTIEGMSYLWRSTTVPLTCASWGRSPNSRPQTNVFPKVLVVVLLMLMLDGADGTTERSWYELSELERQMERLKFCLSEVEKQETRADDKAKYSCDVNHLNFLVDYYYKEAAQELAKTNPEMRSFIKKRKARRNTLLCRSIALMIGLYSLFWLLLTTLIQPNPSLWLVLVNWVKGTGWMFVVIYILHFFWQRIQ